MTENQVSKLIIGEALRIHRILGPGLLESVYENVLQLSLSNMGLVAKRQVPYKVVFDGIEVGTGYKADLVVEDLVIVEVKSVEYLNPSSYKQLLTYLKIADIKLGLMINFSETDLRDGIRRVVNNL